MRTKKTKITRREGGRVMHLFRIRKFKREDGCTHVITSHPGIFFRNSSIHTFQLCYRLGKETRMNCYKKIGEIPRNEKYLTFKRKPLLSCVWNRTTLKYSFHNHTHTYTHTRKGACICTSRKRLLWRFNSKSEFQNNPADRRRSTLSPR